MAAAGLGMLPLVATVRQWGVTWTAAGVLAFVAALLWGTYLASRPLALRLLEIRRERILGAIEREATA
jgi:hypothetical protein